MDFIITAGRRSLSILAAKGHLSVLWGRGQEGGFVLESGAGKNPSGKVVEVWRNDYCGSLNVTAFGLHLVVSSGRRLAVSKMTPSTAL